MKKLLLITISLFAGGSLLFQAGCSGGGGGGSANPFDTASEVGDIVTITAGSKAVNMVYANDQTSITFPFSQEIDPDDTTKATLERKFFISQTEVTNAAFAEVLQWAYNHNKFTGTGNSINSTYAMYGEQIVINLYNSNCHINYSGGAFTVDTGYEDHPVVQVTWYGAIMFCNWLTEMKDGNTDNVVYTGIDTDWEHTETVENADLTGYRLPSSEEWVYSARYIGTSEPTEENLALEYIAQDHNSGHIDLTPDYYWTPVSYASGAVKHAYISGGDPVTYETETRAVAYYSEDPDMGGSDIVMPVAQKEYNQLGLYGMSGNVSEWCFTAYDDTSRLMRGGSCYAVAKGTRVCYWSTGGPENAWNAHSFRFCRTRTE